nr:hypothetical protein [Salmonella enterica]
MEKSGDGTLTLSGSNT